MKITPWLVLVVACAKRPAESAPMYGPAEDYRDTAGSDEEWSKGESSTRAARPMAPPPPPPPSEGASSEPAQAVVQAPAAERMVHYSGHARLRVTRVQEALDAIAAEATGRGGRVEQLTDLAIVVRVPVAEFEAAWAAIRKNGDVVDETVTAADVTENFLAVDLRVRTLTVTRDRLVALLAKAETEQEKIQLLQELRRVTEQLDAFERQRRTLQGLAEFSRIAVDLVPRKAVGGDRSGPAIAGFGWIEQLSPFFRGLGAVEKRASLPVPEGMVALSPKGAFVAESPEGAALWTGRVGNDPQASATFWIDAVSERLATEFASAERTTEAGWSCVTLVDGSDDPYTWDVCALADPADKQLVLAQAFYPSSESVDRYRAGVRAALAGGGS